MTTKIVWWQRLARVDAHTRLIVALVVGAVTFAVLPSSLSWFARGLLAWNAYTLATLALAGLTFFHADPEEAARTAKLEDSSRTAIFVSVLIAACVSMVAVGILIGTAKDLSGARLTAHVLTATLTVLCSWFLVHTIFTLRYAHMYYSSDGTQERRGGLDFPKEDNPDYLDFAYFSFIIGMTCQVSDVDITGRPMRRAALLHGIVSFGFNTAVVAMGVNLISGLFSK